MDLRYVKGALSIASGMAAPFGAYATMDVSLRAAVILSIIAGLTTAHNWLDMAFSPHPVVDSGADASAGALSGVELPHTEAQDSSKG